MRKAIGFVEVKSIPKGDVIAKPAEGKLGACIHASISGTVKEIANNAITIA